MENKIGEIGSDVSYEEFKLGVKCRSITEEKISKQKLHKIKGNSTFILLGLIPIIITVLAVIL